MVMYDLRHISWFITAPIEEAWLWKDGEEQPIPPEVFDQPIDFQPGDRIMILTRGPLLMDAPILSGPKTLRTVLKSIEEGMKMPAPRKLSEEVFAVIRCFRGDMQNEMRMKYAEGKLLMADLIGDHRFFEGGLQRLANGDWIFGTGS